MLKRIVTTVFLSEFSVQIQDPNWIFSSFNSFMWLQLTFKFVIQSELSVVKMEDFEQANSDLDSGLIDEIVCKGLYAYSYSICL